jgi:outer membrane protein assembly factor BamD (BamD/ComL family)
MRKIKYLTFALLLIFAACKSPREKALNRIKEAETKMRSDSSMRINPAVANELITGYMAFAEQFPKDSLAPEFLFKAAEVNNGIGKAEEAVVLYKKVYYEYPNYKKATYCLFLEGFTYETRLKDLTSAANVYLEFLNKYPTHPLADDVKFSLDNIGKSDEELIKQFELQENTAQNK